MIRWGSLTIIDGMLNARIRANIAISYLARIIGGCIDKNPLGNRVFCREFINPDKIINSKTRRHACGRFWKLAFQWRLPLPDGLYEFRVPSGPGSFLKKGVMKDRYFIWSFGGEMELISHSEAYVWVLGYGDYVKPSSQLDLRRQVEARAARWRACELEHSQSSPYPSASRARHRLCKRICHIGMANLSS